MAYSPRWVRRIGTVLFLASITGGHAAERLRDDFLLDLDAMRHPYRFVFTFLDRGQAGDAVFLGFRVRAIPPKTQRQIPLRLKNEDTDVGAIDIRLIGINFVKSESGIDTVTFRTPDDVIPLSAIIARGVDAGLFVTAQGRSAAGRVEVTARRIRYPDDPGLLAAIKKATGRSRPHSKVLYTLAYRQAEPAAGGETRSVGILETWKKIQDPVNRKRVTRVAPATEVAGTRGLVDSLASGEPAPAPNQIASGWLQLMVPSKLYLDDILFDDLKKHLSLQPGKIEDITRRDNRLIVRYGEGRKNMKAAVKNSIFFEDCLQPVTARGNASLERLSYRYGKYKIEIVQSNPRGGGMANPEFDLLRDEIRKFLTIKYQYRETRPFFPVVREGEARDGVIRLPQYFRNMQHIGAWPEIQDPMTSLRIPRLLCEFSRGIEARNIKRRVSIEHVDVPVHDNGAYQVHIKLIPTSMLRLVPHPEDGQNDFVKHIRFRVALETYPPYGSGERLISKAAGAIEMAGHAGATYAIDLVDTNGWFELARGRVRIEGSKYLDKKTLQIDLKDRRRPIRFEIADSSRSIIATERKHFPGTLIIRAKKEFKLEQGREDVLAMKYFPVDFRLDGKDRKYWKLATVHPWTDTTALDEPYVVPVQRRAEKKRIDVLLDEADLSIYRDHPDLLEYVYRIRNLRGEATLDTIRFALSPILGAPIEKRRTMPLWWIENPFEGENTTYEISFRQPKGYRFLRKESMPADKASLSDWFTVRRKNPDPIVLKLAPLGLAQVFWVDLSEEPLNRDILNTSINKILSNDPRLQTDYYFGVSNGYTNLFGRGGEGRKIARNIYILPSGPTSFFQDFKKLYQSFVSAGMSHNRRDARFHLILSRTSMEMLAYNIDYLKETLDKLKIRQNQLRFYAPATWDGVDQLRRAGFSVRPVNPSTSITFDVQP